MKIDGKSRFKRSAVTFSSPRSADCASEEPSHRSTFHFFGDTQMQWTMRVDPGVVTVIQIVYSAPSCGGHPDIPVISAEARWFSGKRRN